MKGVNTSLLCHYIISHIGSLAYCRHKIEMNLSLTLVTFLSLKKKMVTLSENAQNVY